MIIFFHNEGFFDCKMPEIYLRGTDHLLEGYTSSCVVSIYLGAWVLLPSSLIFVSENVIFHLQKRNFSSPTNWRENDMIYFEYAKRWYILI